MPVFAEASFIGQYFPSFFFGNRHGNHRHHAGSRAAVLNDPEQFAVASSLLKPAIGEIARPGIQAPADWPISQAGFSMARDTDPFPFIQCFSLVNDLGRSRFRRTKGWDQFSGPRSFTHGNPGAQRLRFFGQAQVRTGAPTNGPQAHERQEHVFAQESE